MNKSRGFTLVELLVSMSLLSMIVLVGSSGFGLFSQRWDGRLGQFDKTMRNTQNILLTQEVLGSLMPYVAYRRDGKPVIYFEGNRNGFVGVSSRSIFSSSNFAVVRFSVRQRADLAYDVLYEESPMQDDMLVFVGQALHFSQPVVLFDTVNSPRFQYYGWADASAAAREDDSVPKAPPKWFDSFNGLEALHAPLKASLAFNAASGDYLISSKVSSEAPGLLSRYKRNNRRASAPNIPNVPNVPNIPNIPIPAVDDDCDC